MTVSKIKTESQRNLLFAVVIALIGVNVRIVASGRARGRVVELRELEVCDGSEGAPPVARAIQSRGRDVQTDIGSGGMDVVALWQEVAIVYYHHACGTA